MGTFFVHFKLWFFRWREKRIVRERLRKLASGLSEPEALLSRRPEGPTARRAKE
jgi:hypothetical protein